MSLVNMDFRVSGKCECGDVWATEKIVTNEYGAEAAIFGLLHGHESKFPVEHVNMNLPKLITENAEFWSENDDDVLRAIKRGFIKTHYLLFNEQDTEVKQKIEQTNLSGVAVCLVIIKSNKMYVAYAGSAGVTLGVEDVNTHDWAAKRLTEPHTLLNSEEMKRVTKAKQTIVKVNGIPCIGRTEILNDDTSTTPYLCTRSLGDFWSYNDETKNFVVSPEPAFRIIPFDENTRCLIFCTLEVNNNISPQTMVKFVKQIDRDNENNSKNCATDKKWINPAAYLLQLASKTRKYGLFDKHLMTFTIIFDKSYVRNRFRFEGLPNDAKPNTSTYNENVSKNLNLKWEDCMKLCINENDSRKSKKIVKHSGDHTVLPMVLLAKRNATDNPLSDQVKPINSKKKVNTKCKLYTPDKTKPDLINGKTKNQKVLIKTKKLNKKKIKAYKCEDIVNSSQEDSILKIPTIDTFECQNETAEASMAEKSIDTKKKKNKSINKNTKNQKADNPNKFHSATKNDKTHLTKSKSKKILKSPEFEKIKQQDEDTVLQSYELEYQYKINTNIENQGADKNPSEFDNDTKNDKTPLAQSNPKQELLQQSSEVNLNNTNVKGNGIIATKKNKIKVRKGKSKTQTNKMLEQTKRKDENVLIQSYELDYQYKINTILKDQEADNNQTKPNVDNKNIKENETTTHKNKRKVKKEKAVFEVNTINDISENAKRILKKSSKLKQTKPKEDKDEDVPLQLYPLDCECIINLQDGQQNNTTTQPERRRRKQKPRINQNKRIQLRRNLTERTDNPRKINDKFVGTACAQATSSSHNFSNSNDDLTAEEEDVVYEQMDADQFHINVKFDENDEENPEDASSARNMNRQKKTKVTKRELKDLKNAVAKFITGMMNSPDMRNLLFLHELNNSNETETLPENVTSGEGPSTSKMHKRDQKKSSAAEQDTNKTLPSTSTTDEANQEPPQKDRYKKKSIPKKIRKLN